MPDHDQTEPAKSISGSSSIARGDGHRHPISVVRELHPYPISLLSTFADCGTILSGSRAVGGAHIATSDFDLYQLADKQALINIVAVLNLAGIQWHNGFLSQIQKDMGEHELTMIPLDDISRLHERVSGCNDRKQIIPYLKRMLRRGKCKDKYGDLPEKFALALEWCRDSEWKENMIWVYIPQGPSKDCIRELPSAIT